jgi:hypothetical protein
MLFDNKKSDIEPVIIKQENVWLNNLHSYLNFDTIGKKKKIVLIVLLSMLILVVSILIYCYIFLIRIITDLKTVKINFSFSVVRPPLRREKPHFCIFLFKFCLCYNFLVNSISPNSSYPHLCVCLPTALFTLEFR